MNVLSRTITGTIMIIAGFVLTVVSLFYVIFLLIYGIPLLVIGLFILLNKKEDEIEGIKVKGGKKK